MGRLPRITEPEVVYHVLNRWVTRLRLFEKDADHEAFERVVAAALGRPPQRCGKINLTPFVCPKHSDIIRGDVPTRRKTA